MFRDSHIELIRTKGSKLGRALLGLLFFVSGLAMLLTQGIVGVGEMMMMYGLPFPYLAAVLVLAVKIIGGGALIIGRFIAPAAAALILFTLIATLIAHMDFTDQMQMTAALKNLAIVGGLLYVLAFGPGGTNVTGNEEEN